MFLKGDSQLRDQGFTKLVKRDTGVYENVTRREGEDRIVETGKIASSVAKKHKH